MIQGYYEGQTLSEVLKSAFALSAIRLPVNRPFWVIGGGLLTLSNEKGEAIMGMNGKPLPFPVLLLRFVKTDKEAAPKAEAKGERPTAKSGKRFHAETIAATKEDFGIADDVLFLSTVCRDVRDAVDNDNNFVRIAHTGIVAEEARSAQAEKLTNEMAVVKICKAIYAMQDNNKPWVLKPEDYTKLTRDGRRYQAIYVNMVQANEA